MYACEVREYGGKTKTETNGWVGGKNIGQSYARRLNTLTYTSYISSDVGNFKNYWIPRNDRNAVAGYIMPVPC